ncbi:MULTISPECIES: hypothetical protein [unclassified Nocardiopsis]|uniref:hypothetical protein n=1 Tax=Nocardiopsis TaxID=2013 RepID=UPI00387AE418
MDWAPNPSEGDKQLFVFDGGVIGREWVEQISLDPAELADYAFHDVASVGEVTIPRLARWIVQADHARREGATAYLENGEAVS